MSVSENSVEAIADYISIQIIYKSRPSAAVLWHLSEIFSCTSFIHKSFDINRVKKNQWDLQCKRYEYL